MVNENHLPLSEEQREILGEWRSTHLPGSSTHNAAIVILVCFALACIVPGLFLILVVGKDAQVMGWICLAVALIPACLLYIVGRMLWWRLDLYENGFVLKQRRIQIVPYKEVKYYYGRQVQQFGVDAGGEVRLVLLDGRKLKIESAFQDFGAFAAAVHSGVTKAVLVRAEAALTKGEVMPFGKLELSKTGLEKNRDYSPVVRACRDAPRPPKKANESFAIEWAQIESITVEPVENIYAGGRMFGVVIFARPKNDPANVIQWFIAPIPVLANYEAFLRLAERFAPGKVVDAS